MASWTDTLVRRAENVGLKIKDLQNGELLENMRVVSVRITSGRGYM